LGGVPKYKWLSVTDSVSQLLDLLDFGHCQYQEAAD
jgi:hypothetical protein